MAKKIVVFSDGTGNSAAKVFKTNVWRMYQALDVSQPDQIAFYDDGVGTSSFRPMAVLGGALGVGLARNVRQLYAFISRNYQPGDTIHAFGFSRGAFSIRVLAGLICGQGLIPNQVGGKPISERDRGRFVNNAYRAFRSEFNSTGGLVTPLRLLRDAFIALWTRLNRLTPYAAVAPSNPKPNIAFLGLWDTVDAYGLPIDELTRAWDQYFWPLFMRERDLSTKVERACHVLALDDERATFHPVLWNEATEPPNPKHVDEERISQVWFTGMHSNVGGGYADDALSYVSFEWMRDRAHQAGLRFMPGVGDPPLPPAAPAPATSFGAIGDSRKSFGSAYRYQPRKVELLANDTFDRDNKVIVARPKIHYSVFERIRAGGDDYAPIVLPDVYDVVEADGKITPNLYEHPTQAASRKNRQEEVWNRVWWRRGTYFTTVAVSTALALRPLFLDAHPEGGCEGRLCAVSPAIEMLGQFLPGMASPWIAGYRAHPTELIVLLVVLVFLLRRSSAAQAEIGDRMRGLWAHVIAGNTTEEKPVAAAPKDWLYQMRMSPAYRGAVRRLKYTWLPFLFAVAFAAVGFIGLSRSVTAVVGAFGLTCKRSSTLASQHQSDFVLSQLFSTDSPCWASGVQVVEGQRYEIELTVVAPWSDDSIPAGLGGLSAEQGPPWYFRPFRREFRQPWFKPIARISARRDDEYPLDPKDPVAKSDDQHLVSRFTARTTGELFLFVNDATLFGWNGLYAKNLGTARVKVTRLSEGD